MGRVSLLIMADLHENEGLCLLQTQMFLKQMKDCFCANHKPSF
jgi:hypothetical protein